MVYIMVGCLALLGLLHFLAPKQYAARAGRSSGIPFWIRSSRRQATVGPLKDSDGSYIDTRGKLVGYAFGDSMKDKVGNECLFVATYLTDEERRVLKAGDVVVIDAPAGASVIKKRLRTVAGVENDCISFSADRYGKAHRPRPIHEVEAKVEWAEQNC